jgi:hypothetical protein
MVSKGCARLTFLHEFLLCGVMQSPSGNEAASTDRSFDPNHILVFWWVVFVTFQLQEGSLSAIRHWPVPRLQGVLRMEWLRARGTLQYPREVDRRRKSVTTSTESPKTNYLSATIPGGRRKYRKIY